MKNKKIISLVGFIFVLLFLSGVASPITLTQDNIPEMSQGEVNPDGLILVNFSVMIGDHGIYGNYPNWSYYVDNYSWATGNGTEKDPYIIEGIHVTNENKTAHISIETTEHFIIRNVMVSNYAKPAGHYIYAGIYIGKGEFGLIDNVTIINTSIGISLYEAKDSLKITNSRFIGSHNDSKTGMGSAILIHEAKGVNISYNDIYNFYNGIVVYDAEEVYIENNRIETNFGYISDTGLYFYNVNDSTIINNDFYGSNFTGHKYDEPKTSSLNDFPFILENSYNITIYGNMFYDKYTNLKDEPDIPDIPDDLNNDDINIPDIIIPNILSSYIIFILISVVGSLISVSLFLKLRKKEK
ncbi:hypothetical protein LCGC14_0770340 [marine sediment metagenome]|uniref:Periplasmic copper-binding protein NosD beta helix domain-containing protein n=1 Tax=marine sediment metagenome TaxID=412755 RepID=A0A0F9Q2S9_9ZZZZ